MTERSAILERAVVEQMHAAALSILARTGLRVEHGEIRERLLRRKGFTEDDGRLLIAPERVGAWRVRHATHKVPVAPEYLSFPPDQYVYGADCRARWIVDDAGTGLRLLTRDDLVAGAKLLRMLEDCGVTGTTPGVPCDAPEETQALEQYVIAAEFSSHGGYTCQVADVTTAEIVREMDRVYGRPRHLTAYNPSPLIFGGPEVDILWHFREELDSALVGSMPAMGVTGPCDLIGVFTLAIAECLGAAAILHELLPEVSVTIYPHPQPADMRSGTMVFGSAEWQLLDLMHRDVLDYYGSDLNRKMIHTTAPLPNAQAQTERTAAALLGMTNGFTLFEPIGQLGLDEVWSPAQCMLDLDILGEAQRIARGAAPCAGLELEQLAEVTREAVQDSLAFSVHPTTLSNMNSVYHHPRVLSRCGRPQWAAAGMPDPVREARRQAEHLVASYDRGVDEERLREVRRIYEWGCERLRQKTA